MSSKTTQPTAAIRDRETDAAVEQLRGEVRDLEDDVRRLHEQLARMHARLVPEPGAEELDISQLELAPPRPPRPLFERLVRKLARSAARFIRGAIRALSPSHDPIHRLRLVAGRHAAGTLPSIGAGDDVDLIVDSPARLSEGRLSDLQLLFASEMIDGACLGCATIRRRTMPAWTGRDDLDGLHRAAIALRRAVVVKDLDMRPASTSDLGLRPAGLGGASHCWRGGPYLVAMPKDQRVAELPVCADLPPADLIPVVGGLLIVIDQPLVNGLERRVGAILEATPNRRGATIVSLAASGQPGGRRLDLLDGPDCRTMSLGATVNSTLFGAIASRIVQTGSFTDLWAIGEGPVLQRFVVSCAAASSTLRVIWEPLREPQQRFAQAAVTVARTAEDRRRWRARWPEHEVVLVPTPAGPTESFVPPAETSRRLPGTRVVLFADDLSPESRPEDAIAVARHLGDRSDIRVDVVGEGSMADTVADLARLFGLERLRLLTGTHDTPRAVAEADVLCVPHDGPLLTTAAAAAMRCGTSIVTVDGSGELASIAERRAHPVTVAGPPGDTHALAEAIMAALDGSQLSQGAAHGPEQEAESETAIGDLLDR